jgi:stage IV sporulation protein FB
MRDVLSWSLNLGRFGGVQVRLHVFFLLAAAYALHLGLLYEGGRLLGFALLTTGILLASVLLHELGHYLAARRLGGAYDQILLWPFGGLTAPHLHGDPSSEMLVALSGPAVNLLVCCAAAAGLQGIDVRFEDLLNPLVPPIMAADAVWFPWRGCLEMTFWLNWLLVLVNLLPAFPLDGARALRAGMAFAFPARVAGYLAAVCGQLAAVGVWISAWWLNMGPLAYATMPLVLLGIFMFFAALAEADRCREIDQDELTLGYDFSQGYTSLERQQTEAPPVRNGLLRQWIDNCRESRRRRQLEQESEEERRVDAILARLHETGRDALSPQDQALLLRVSQRYRDRLGR